MGHFRIREAAYRANMEIVEAGLVLLTWGNASARDVSEGVYAIKPSGVSYNELSPEAMVLVSVATGAVVEGDLKPSSDAPTHTELYRAFARAGGVVHTHSHYAVVYAQARRPIPIMGTTHADHFRGSIPLTRMLSAAEVARDYEAETGRVIVETFRSGDSWEIDPEEIPAVLVAGHGPFAWGASAAAAVENAVVLEEVGRMAFHARALNPDAGRAPKHLTEKHFLRKHGPGAYYGQSGSETAKP